MSNGRGYGGGAGDGKGCGMGKEMGRGRGGGSGNGRGQGMGRGMGQGRGGGRGMGSCQKLAPMAAASPKAPEPRDTAQQAQALEARAQDMRNQLSAINKRIAQLEAAGTEAPTSPEPLSKTASNGENSFRNMIAVVDQERCTCRGLCIDSCPQRAISMNDTVTIDASQCNGCGSCVKECPNEAISLFDAAQRAAL